MHNFCDTVTNSLQWLDHHSDCTDYTFYADSLGVYSLIDHFICSRDIVECNDCVINIHNDDDNLSDHLAIECCLHIEALCPYAGNSSECLLSRNTSPKLLWDRANLDEYRHLLNMYLSGIILPYEALSCSDVECSGHRDCIESYYNDIVRYLHLASQCVPCASVGI